MPIVGLAERVAFNIYYHVTLPSNGMRCHLQHTSILDAYAMASHLQHAVSIRVAATALFSHDLSLSYWISDCACLAKPLSTAVRCTVSRDSPKGPPRRTVTPDTTTN